VCHSGGAWAGRCEELGGGVFFRDSVVIKGISGSSFELSKVRPPGDELKTGVHGSCRPLCCGWTCRLRTVE